MKIAKLYDKISKSYEKYDHFGIINKSENIALNQIQNTPLLAQENVNVADLGVGDGKFLRMLHAINPRMQFTGLDISSEMLNIAKSKLNINTVQTSIANAHHYLHPQNFDLVIADFVCAYVPLTTILDQAYYLLKPYGFLSLVTTTKDSFKNIQQQITKMGVSKNPCKKITHHFTRSAIEETCVPINQNDMIKQITQHQFHLVKQEQLTIDIAIDHPQKFLKAAFEGGWAISILDQPLLPTFLLSGLAKLFVTNFQFPLQDQAVMEIMLLQKNDGLEYPINQTQKPS